MLKYLVLLPLIVLFGFTYDTSFERKTNSETLAKSYCGSCHEFPEPALLDKVTWEKSVLPDMGWRLGVRVDHYNPFDKIAPEEVETVKSLNIYPEKQLISNKDWKAILKYYKKNAPLALESGRNDTVNFINKAPFNAQMINLGEDQTPQVSLLEYDEETATLYIGNDLKLYSVESTGILKTTWDLESPAVDFVKNDTKNYVLNIGSIVPSDRSLGSFGELSIKNAGGGEKLLGKLARPVHSEIADLNGDGRGNALISSFGHHTGSLSWYDDTGEERIISTLPGNRRTETIDMDGDGDLDIIAMNSQAREGLSIYYNDGRGKFKEDRILKFSPVHGLSYFETVDFNNDGHLDILLTNGDSYDLSPIRKPYHGVHIYMNDGLNNFKEQFFFHHSGCNKAMSADFDGDGDQDIIVSAFYDLLSDAHQSIMYLENKGNLEFSASYVKEAVAGNWLTMDVADFNADGFKDVFLGSYYFSENAYKRASRNGKYKLPQVLLLINSNGRQLSF